jgi:hypothetical protein
VLKRKKAGVGERSGTRTMRMMLKVAMMSKRACFMTDTHVLNDNIAATRSSIIHRSRASPCSDDN